MEHLPKSLSPTGKIDSAPKNFSLYVSVLGKGGDLASVDVGVVSNECAVHAGWGE